eukprot:881369-Prymnesium_polylepis.1
MCIRDRPQKPEPKTRTLRAHGARDRATGLPAPHHPACLPPQAPPRRGRRHLRRARCRRLLGRLR